MTQEVFRFDVLVEDGKGLFRELVNRPIMRQVSRGD